MKRITFLIGNGFDVGLGLRSQYADFYKFYTDPSDQYYPKDENLVGLAASINDNEPYWSYYEKILGEYASGFSGKPKEVQDCYVKQHEHFQQQFYDYLLTVMSDLELPTRDTSTGTLNDPRGAGKHMMEALLRIVNMNFKSKSHRPGYPPSSETNSADKNLAQLLEDPELECTFLSFNYTDLLDRCLDAIPATRTASTVTIPRTFNHHTGTVHVNLEVHHVHGDLRDRSANRPVMGVNDVGQIRSFELADMENIKNALVKSKITNNTCYRKGKKQLRSNSDIVVVYGMSVGVTDNCWWGRILKLLKDSGVHLVFFIHDKNYQQGGPTNPTMIHKKWKDSLMNAVMTPEGPHLETVTTPNGRKPTDAARKKFEDLLNERISFVINEDPFQKDLTKNTFFLDVRDDP